MKELQRICVFCGSSSGSDPAFVQAAKATGRTLAKMGVGLVFGGGNIGLMGVVADAALELGGEVIGVIPKSLEGKELAHRGLLDLRVVASMHERKALMADLADGFIALPGGFGTIEEISEILTWAQLGLHRKPIGVLNVSGYFNHLIAWYDHAVSQRLLSVENRGLALIDVEINALLKQMVSFRAPPAEKWLDRVER